MGFPEEDSAIRAILENCKDNPCVVELGSNWGEEAQWMISVFKDRSAKFILVEADPTNFFLLAAKRFPATIIHAAIMDYNGTCDFYECRQQGGGFGSVYPPIEGAISHSVDKFNKIGPINCITFDYLFKQEGLDHIDFLSADIHGAERHMITHGQEALKHTRYLFMEAVGYRMYEGAATETELLALLPNWKLVRRFPWNLLLENEKYSP